MIDRKLKFRKKPILSTLIRYWFTFAFLILFYGVSRLHGVKVNFIFWYDRNFNKGAWCQERKQQHLTLAHTKLSLSPTIYRYRERDRFVEALHQIYKCCCSITYIKIKLDYLSWQYWNWSPVFHMYPYSFVFL